jgi:hypothetical protein
MGEKIDSETLVYWIVLEKGPVGIRDAQKFVGFDSPSTALYHLERLEHQGLIYKDSYGKYHVAKYVKKGMLRFFVLLGRHLVPRSLVYAITLSIIELIVLSLLNLRVEMLLSLIPAFVAALIFWYEAFDLMRYKKRLFKRCSNLRTQHSKT